jgi:hypothetical protein
VIVVAGAIVVGSFLLGLWRLNEINHLHGEYVLALRLGRAFVPFHKELAATAPGQGVDLAAAVPPNSFPLSKTAALLYGELGCVSMVELRSQRRRRDAVGKVLKQAQADRGTSG